ncbi:MAG: hypothetical protein ACI87W_001681 [Halieaceae bacterium]
MEELQLALTSARVDQRNFGLWINNWQIGQTLNALVTNQLPNGDLVLRVGGQQITATADIPIQQGANLQLEVKQLQPIPTLRVLNPLSSAAAASNVGGTLQLLPASGGSLGSTPLASVAQSLQNTQVAMMALPPILADSLSQLLRMTTRAQQLGQSEGLARAVRNSGLFLESGLKASMEGKAASTTGDFKGGLFRALGHVDAALAEAEAISLPPADAESLRDMKRELEGGLGRIIMHQLNSQPADAAAARSWHLEIPVQLGQAFHNVRIDIEHDPPEEGGESGAGEEAEEHWNVRLQLAPGALGAVDINVQLAGDNVQLRLAAARPEVRALIDRQLPALERSLASRGLALQFSGTVALVARDNAASPPASTGSYLDMRA